MSRATDHTRPPRGAPRATYRLQLHAGFGFDDAAAVVPHLARLGVSHVYLSPILQAVPGSMHGYDVVDHSRVSDELGGAEGLLRLADVAHAHDLGIVLDVVPNHMAIPDDVALNRQLWTTLRDGPSGEFASWFDVEWEHLDGRLGLPILDGPVEEAVARGEIRSSRTDIGEVLEVGDRRLPLAHGTADLPVDRLLASQHYVLADWRAKHEVLNYRRFFDVDSLIAVRVERADVFAATHAVLLDLHSSGVVDGFRIDHPDGLADPEEYLARLSDATDDAWVVVEKILVPGEALPTTWRAAGTTGYEAIRLIDHALLPETTTGLDDRWDAVRGSEPLPTVGEVELTSMHDAVEALLEPEVQRLTRAALRATDAGSATSVAAAFRALLAHVERYRIYLRLDEPVGRPERRLLDELSARSARAEPELAGTIGTVVRLVSDTCSADAATRDLVVRFQQVCGPARAKGIEDTACYRWQRMLALNEVGGDLASHDRAGADALFDWTRHQRLTSPNSLIARTTHDTKRSGDARARLLALAGDLAAWDAWWDAVRPVTGSAGLPPDTGVLVLQTLAATWPIEPGRLHDFLVKASREGKQYTSWTDPDATYETRLRDASERVVVDPQVIRVAERWLRSGHERIRSVTLAQSLLHLCLPGVPDVYQGTELTTLTLVDPDNRRPVDFSLRAGMLRALDESGLARVVQRADPEAALAAEQLWLTSRILRLRRDRPDLFDAGLADEPVRGLPAVLGFVRDARLAVLTVRWPDHRTLEGGTIGLPSGRWRDVVTDRSIAGTGAISARRIFAELPVAVLIREDVA